MKPVYTLTFGECAENHKGMQQIGHLGETGFSVKDLEDIYLSLKDKHVCILKDLNTLIDKEAERASILIIKNGTEIFDIKADDLLKEQNGLLYDTKAYMYGRVVNKKARHNICFSDVSQLPAYDEKKGTIVKYTDVPLLNTLRIKLPSIFKEKSEELKIEGNKYYDPKTCFIGWHGDSERKKVIAVRLGEDFPLKYQWYYQSEAVGERFEIILNHGDMYMMSEKATGFDWKRPSIYTLRHAAGFII